MRRYIQARPWLGPFAALVLVAFAGFCGFWVKKLSRAATISGSAVEIAGGCAGGPVTEESDPAHKRSESGHHPRSAATSGTLDVDNDLDEEAFIENQSSPYQAEQVQRQGQVYGPYALSVRDGLNDMMLGSQLAARGIQTSSQADLNAVLGALPSVLPAHGFMTSGFGYRRSPFSGRVVHHSGIDFSVPYGSPVFATGEGRVIFAEIYPGLGKTVAIDHGFGMMTRYGHNSALAVKVGDFVRRGQKIARAGNTGRSTGVHVHYEVWINGQAIDPEPFLFDSFSKPAQVLQKPLAGRTTGLGLAMGGERIGGHRPPRAATKPSALMDHLPMNLAIFGTFFIVVLAVVASLVPRSDDRENMHKNMHEFPG